MEYSVSKEKFNVEMMRQGHLERLETQLQWDLDSRALIVKILTLLNEEVVEIDVIKKIFAMVKEFTGFEAVAIRLRESEDFPYALADGLTDDFIEAENSLCSCNKSGEIVRDCEGLPVLECICGQVIRGEIDRSLPFFSAWGSFWTNARSKLLASSYGNKLASVARERFISCGHESVAIIPLRSSGETVGLLQFNDEREGCFSPEMVLFFEAIGSVISIVFARLQAEQGLRQAKDELELRVERRTAALSSAKNSLEQEIQERKMVEEELLLASHRLELAMESSKLKTWDWNIDTDVVCFDQRWCTILGYSPANTDVKFDTWQSRIHEEDKPNVLKSLEAHLANPARYFEAEYRFETETGEWKWFLERGKVVERDAAGKPLRMAGICLDITDRKQMEEELQESAERFRGIFVGAKDCIFVKNASLQYTHVNPAFVKMMGLQESEIVGQTDANLYDRDTAEILHEVDLRVLRGESVEQERARVIRNHRRTFIDTKVPMWNNRGEIIGIVGISVEITDRKRIECVPPANGADYSSARMRLTQRSALLAAGTDSTVLLIGESGSGKDYMARYIHDHSKRANGPFFLINCAAVAPELAESELFGYEAGAFTGSKGSKRGLFELAEGGTILLNEIGELSLPLQAKLLSFLDTRQFTRVGGVKLLTVNTRLIAATNRNLQKEVKLKRFREDLFYRLDVFRIEVPPLRRRTEDIPHLVDIILEDLSSKMGLDSVPRVSPLALKALTKYHWPGNVRELRNLLERALILCDKRNITIRDLAINNKFESLDKEATWSVTIGFPENETINDVSMNLKRLLVMEALRRTGGSRKRAADLLGISPDSLKHYLRSFDLYTVLPVPSRLTV